MLLKSIEHPKSLILPIFPKKDREFKEFYIFSIETKLLGGDFEGRKRYLTKISPCAVADIFEKRIKFFIDPTVFIFLKDNRNSIPTYRSG